MQDLDGNCYTVTIRITDDPGTPDETQSEDTQN